MTTREQDEKISEIVLRLGPTRFSAVAHVKPGFADGVVVVTTPDHAEYRISHDGRVIREGFSHAIDWEAYARGELG